MITITIHTNNDAFSGGNRAAEVARILRDLASKIARNATVSVRDINGNTCGTVVATELDTRII